MHPNARNAASDQPRQSAPISEQINAKRAQNFPEDISILPDLSRHTKPIKNKRDIQIQVQKYAPVKTMITRSETKSNPNSTILIIQDDVINNVDSHQTNNLQNSTAANNFLDMLDSHVNMCDNTQTSHPRYKDRPMLLQLQKSFNTTIICEKDNPKVKEALKSKDGEQW